MHLPVDVNQRERIKMAGTRSPLGRLSRSSPLKTRTPRRMRNNGLRVAQQRAWSEERMRSDGRVQQWAWSEERMRGYEHAQLGACALTWAPEIGVEVFLVRPQSVETTRSAVARKAGSKCDSSLPPIILLLSETLCTDRLSVTLMENVSQKRGRDRNIL